VNKQAPTPFKGGPFLLFPFFSDILNFLKVNLRKENFLKIENPFVSNRQQVYNATLRFLMLLDFRAKDIEKETWL